MATFRTHIVEARKVSVTLRITIAVILIISVYFLYFDYSFQDAYLNVIFSILYLLSMVSAFGINLLKPKSKGELELDASGIRFQIADSKKKFYFSDIDNLRFQYKTYGGWWSHNFHGNENILSFKTNEGEEYSFEIYLRIKSIKKDLRRYF